MRSGAPRTLATSVLVLTPFLIVVTSPCWTSSPYVPRTNAHPWVSATITSTLINVCLTVMGPPARLRQDNPAMTCGSERQNRFHTRYRMMAAIPPVGRQPVRCGWFPQRRGEHHRHPDGSWRRPTPLHACGGTHLGASRPELRIHFESTKTLHCASRSIHR